MTVWRFNYFNQKFEAKAEDLFELPVLPSVEIPQEWLDQIKVPTYAIQTKDNKGRFTKMGGSSYQGNVLPTGQQEPGKWRYPTENSLGWKKPDETRNESEFKDAGIISEFFDHHSEYQKELNEYYESLGIETVGNPLTVNNQTKSQFTSGEEALAVVREVQDEEDAQSHLSLDPNGPEINNPQYEQVTLLYGSEVADSWWAIDQEMATLDGKDELTKGLISDMFQMVTETEQSKLLRGLYEQLSPRERERIEQNGF